MTSILAIDTAADFCSVALHHAGTTIQRRSDAVRKHAAEVLPMVQSVLAESQAQLGQLDAIAMVSGPGSFTGLRIGTAVVQGLAFGANIPVISLSALAILARAAFIASATPAGHHKVIHVCLHARENEFYFASYNDDGTELPSSLTGDQIADPATIQELILSGMDGKALIAGDGWLQESLQTLLTEISAPDAITGLCCDATLLAELALQALAAGQVQDAGEALPVYLKEDMEYRKS